MDLSEKQAMHKKLDSIEEFSSLMQSLHFMYSGNKVLIEIRYNGDFRTMPVYDCSNIDEAISVSSDLNEKFKGFRKSVSEDAVEKIRFIFSELEQSMLESLPPVKIKSKKNQNVKQENQDQQNEESQFS